jgi:hypothetical protein
MGTNCAALHVHLGRRLRKEQVEQAIVDWYTRLGATRGKDVWSAKLSPFGLSDAKRGKASLGVALLAKPVNGWLAVIDSERYTADAALARHLATTLRTTVYWEAVAEVANSYVVVRFGPVTDWQKCATSGETAYYDQLDASRDWTYLQFGKVPSKAYEASPEEAPRADLHCEKCDEDFTYLLGQDTKLTPTLGMPEDWGEPPSKPDGQLLLAADHAECGAEPAAWMSARWQGNLVTSLTALPGYPAKRSKYFYEWPNRKPAKKARGRKLATLHPASVITAGGGHLYVECNGERHDVPWRGPIMLNPDIRVAFTSSGTIYKVELDNFDGTTEVFEITQ